MQKEMIEKIQTFKLALSRALNKIVDGSSYTTVACSYDIAQSTLTPILKGLVDPQFSTIFRISEAYQIDPTLFVKMVMDELPDGFTFSDV